MMLALTTPCETPSHSAWHLVSGVATLMLIWAALVMFVTWVA